MIRPGPLLSSSSSPALPSAARAPASTRPRSAARSSSSSSARARLVALAVLLLTVLTAGCDDPSTVGTDLIGAQGGNPRRVEVPLAVDTVRYDAVTGQQALAEQSRVLAGQTQDDPLGDVSATGYLDFALAQGPSTLPNETVQAARLLLKPGYVYGDTTATTTYALHDVSEEWDAAGAPADTSLADITEESTITQFTLAPGDTLATVELPGSWVQEHADDLARPDSGVAREFHGFQIEPLSGGNVTGFPTSGMTLEATLAGVPTDTSVYRPTKLLTTVRQPAPEQIPDRLVLQDGTGRALQFSLSLPDSLSNVSLNQARLIVEVDSMLTALPSNYARPTLQNVQLFVKIEDEDAPRPFVFQGSAVAPSRNGDRFASGALIDVVQSMLVDDPPIEGFQLHPFSRTTIQTQFGTQSVPLPSLNSALIRIDERHRPRLELTYTPTD